MSETSLSVRVARWLWAGINTNVIFYYLVKLPPASMQSWWVRVLVYAAAGCVGVWMVSFVPRVYRHARALKLVVFRDTPWLLSFDPILRCWRWCRRARFEQRDLENALSLFTWVDGHSYYRLQQEVRGFPVERLRAAEQFTIVLKLPVRPFLSVPDFQDLRLLRLARGQGARVLVLLLDVSYDEKRPRTVIDTKRTAWWVRRIVGSGSRVVSLSEVLGKNPGGFVRFLLDTYVPIYGAHLLDGVPPVGRTDAGSYLLFGLRLYALRSLIGASEPIAIVQWRQRLDKWRLFAGMSSELLALRFCAFVVGETFVDGSGTKVPTARETHSLFTMTEPKSDVARKLLARRAAEGNSSWALPDDYVAELARNLFGRQKSGTAKGADQRLRRMAQEFYEAYGDKEGPLALEDAATLRSLVLRYEFFEGFARIQSDLNKRMP